MRNNLSNTVRAWHCRIFAVAVFVWFLCSAGTRIDPSFKYSDTHTLARNRGDRADADRRINDKPLELANNSPAGGTGTAIWDGSSSTSWFVASNWVGNVVPSAGDDVVINGSYTNAPTLDLSAGKITINSLTIGSSVTSVLTVINGDLNLKILDVVNDLTIGANGTLTHTPNSSVQTNSLFLTVGGDLTIAAGGKIDISARGFAGTSAKGGGSGGGTGTRSDSNGGGGGGAYGGNGGAPQSTYAGGIAYGAFLQPVDLGSAGGAGFAGVGGAGGGAVRLSVSGTLTVNGTINATGGNGASHGYGSSGGGSGGSIWIQTNTLAGGGSIVANGGASYVVSEEDGASGGGGRIAIEYTTNNFSGLKSAIGGTGGNQSGGAGTIFLKQTDEAIGSLIIDNLSTPVGANTPLGTTSIPGNLTINKTNVTHSSGLTLAGSLSLTSANFNLTAAGSTLDVAGSIGLISSNLTIASASTIHAGGTVQIPSGSSITAAIMNIETSVTIYAGGTLRHNAADLTGLNVTTPTMDIQSGGQISIQGIGYQGTSTTGGGPGGGTGTRADSNGGGGGGAYGGNGGAPQSSYAGGTAYGSFSQPTNLGSAGGAGYAGVGGAGGGAVRLSVSGGLTVNGTINATGGNGASHGYGSSGGGSGGSIWIQTNALAGGGTIVANGGASYVVSEEDGASGGGGRIAIEYASNNFTGSMSAIGGVGGNQNGGAGTIYLKQSDEELYDLIIDNLSTPAGANTPPCTNVIAGNLYINKTTVTQSGNLSVSGNLTITSGALNVTGTTNNISGSLVLNSAAINYSAANSTLDIGGSVAVNSSGFSIGSASVTNISGSLTTSGTSTFNAAVVNVTGSTVIGSGGTLTHNSADVTGLIFKTPSFDLQSGAKIDISGKGFTGTNTKGNGTGGGTGTRSDGNGGGGGGGYGGAGGAPQSSYAGGITYGSATEPRDLGSAGGAGYAGVGGSGGGALKLIVSGTLNINGSILSTGATGASHGYGASGGGSGGSIWIQAGILNGAGPIAANGGVGPIVSEEDAGGGGGGRIAIEYVENNFTGTKTVNGGTGYRAGGVGTITMKYNGAIPSVKSIVPGSGLITGGTTVTVTGSNFVNGTAINFSGVQAVSVTFLSDTTLSVVTPPHAVGIVNVTASNPDGWMGTLSNGYTYLNLPPVILSLDKTTGPASGGTIVTITGTDFLEPPTVKVGGIAAINVQYINSTTVIFTTPAHAVGSEDVMLTNYDGQSSTLPQAFTYTPPPTIASVSPSSMLKTGGEPITITGSGFTATSVVNFGDVAAQNVTFVNPTTLTVVVPAHDAGIDDVIVTNPDGQSAILANGFNFIDLPPVVSAVTPASGSTVGGTNITISGTNFIAGGLGSGGTITTSGAYTIHTFTSGGTFSVPTARDVEVLVVGGGGGGGKAEPNPGGDGAGGGGAGGLIYRASFPAAGHIAVVIGSGGNGSTSNINRGANGNNTVFGTLMAIGGGGGGSDNDSPTNINKGADGGSGGGAANSYNQTTLASNGTSEQGNPGGGASQTTTARGGSGGGGAGAAGVTRTSQVGGAGGTGAAYSILNGSSVYYAGGGGGGGNSTTGGAGGTGGGGAGGNSAGTGASGAANSGGGGGGGGANGGNGGNGGSGIVIVKYLTPVTGVTIDGVPATKVKVINSTTITAVTPTHNAGTVNITVTNYDGQSSSLVNSFTYVNPPTVTSVSPSGGLKEGGGLVTIKGSDFTGVPTVTFDGIPGTEVVLVDANTITVKTPAHISGIVDVTVTNPDGQADTLTGGFIFEERPPSILDITPISGPSAGGTNVTITGSNFITGGTGTGGTITTSGPYTIHTFSSSGTFIVPTDRNVEVWAWGGGGAGGTVGGWSYGSPGGAGGAAYGKLNATAGSSYVVKVGGGGAVNSTVGAEGGGGPASNDNYDNRYSGGGGGYSGLFYTSASQANALLIAGGGGWRWK